MTREEKIALLKERNFSANDMTDFSRQEKIKQLEAIKKNDRMKSYGITDYLAPIARGATLGFGDELSALAAASMAKIGGDIPEGQGFMDAYRDIHKDISGQQKQFDIDNPIISTIADIGGSIATGGPLGKLAQKGLQHAIAGGVGAGAAAGAGYADEGERLSGAGIGAATGGILGGATKKATDILSAKISPGARQFNKAIEADKLTPTEIRDQLTGGNMPMDLGNNIASQARAIRSSPGEGATTIQKALETRQQQMGPDLMASIRKNTGKKFGFFGDKQDIIAKRGEKVKPLYKALEGMPIEPTEEMFGLIEDKSLKSLFKKANKTTVGYGVNPPEDFPTGDFRFWDHAKKTMDDKIRVAGRKGNNFEAGQLIEAKNLINDGVNESTGGLYGQARNMFAGDSKLIDAGDLGNKALRMNLDDVKFQLSNMSAGEKQMFINGMASDLGETIARQPDTANLARNLRKSPLMKDKLRSMFPDTGSYDKFMDDVERYAKQGETFNAVNRGSQTAESQAHMGGFDSGSIMADLLRFRDPVGASIDVGAGLLDKFRGIKSNKYNKQIGSQFADIATARTPEKFGELMKKIGREREVNRGLQGGITGLIQLLSQP